MPHAGKHEQPDGKPSQTNRKNHPKSKYNGLKAQVNPTKGSAFGNPQQNNPPP